MAKAQTIIFLLLIFPIVGLGPTECWGQVDSSMVQDTLSQAVSDSVAIDSVAADSAQQSIDSTFADNAHNKSISDVQYPFERQPTLKMEQKPLPNPKSWSVTDTSNLEANYFEAIEDRFSLPVIAKDSLGSQNLFYVVGPEDTLNSIALIEGYPYLRSYVNYHRKMNALDQNELKELKDSLAYHFKNRIKVHLLLRSYNIRAMAMDTTKWMIRLTAGDISIEPDKILRLPVKTEVWGKLVWYRRKILLSFPRFVGANDLIYDPRLGLQLKMRNQSTDSTVYKANYVVNFTNVIEGGATYKQ